MQRRVEFSWNQPTLLDLLLFRQLARRVSRSLLEFDPGGEGGALTFFDFGSSDFLPLRPLSWTFWAAVALPLTPLGDSFLVFWGSAMAVNVEVANGSLLWRMRRWPSGQQSTDYKRVGYKETNA